MNRHARYEAFIPPEPLGLQVVRDQQGDVWDRVSTERGIESHTWRCMKPKIGNLFGGSPFASWRQMVIGFGPVYPLVWSDSVAAEGEQGGTPDAGQPDHPVG